LSITNDLSIGSVATDSGTSALNVGTGTLNIGGDTYIREGGTLSLAAGGTFNPTGAVNLNGGTLSVDSIGSLAPNWTSGTLEVTGAAGLAVNLNGALGGNPINIDAGKTLNVTNLLQINSAAIFEVNGGTVNAGDLTAFFGTINANSGSVNVAGTFTNTGTVNLAGADVTVNTFDASVFNPSFTDGSLTIDGGPFIPFAGLADFTLESASGNPTLNLQNSATLDVVGTLNVARNANTDAALNIHFGSDVTSGAANIGDISFISDAIVNVDGAGSTWLIDGDLEVGHGNDSGQSANAGRDVLTVSNGAEVDVDGVVIFGTTGRVNIDDADVTAKGWVRNSFSQFGWTGGSLTIDTGDFGSGSSSFTLGHADRNILNMVNGATHTGTNVDITNGEWHVLSGSDVNLTGAASLQLFNTGVGDAALLEVDGVGSSVSVNGIVDIGTTVGGDGTLIITNGGTFTSNSTMAIAENDTTIGLVTVDGTGSSLNVSGALFVGNEGQATLDVTNGGLVNTGTFTVADSDTNNSGTGTSTVTIDGTDGVTPSTLNVTGLSEIGGSSNEDGGVGILNVQAGALYDSNGGIIGSGDGTGTDGTGTVNITGADSFWNSVANGTNDIFVGDTGAGTLNVTAGGRVDADAMFIGDNAGSETAAMTVDGINSVVNVRGAFVTGNGRLGTLEVTNSATLNTSTLTNAEFLIGNSTTSDNSSVLVDNAAIVHNGTGRVAVGDDSNGVASSLTIQNGGVFTANNSVMLIADQAGSTGNLIVDGEGSTLTVGRMLMGDNGAGTATISGGADLIVNAPGSQIGNLEVSAFGGGTGTMTVTGPGSTVTVGSWLSVGDEGTANGTLNILDGGSVTTLLVEHAYIARVGSASTGVINVQDLDTNDGSSGSSLNVGRNLYLGGNSGGGGGDATLNVNAGGTVNVAGLLKLWDDGKVNLNGGTINVTTFDLHDPAEAPQPDFNFISGTFRYTAGATLNSETLDDLLGPGVPTLTANKTLVVTDQAVLSAPVRLNGGTTHRTSTSTRARLTSPARTSPSARAGSSVRRWW
jgi:T5SS/PEP-CTERM-associated repeat protein